MKLRKSSLYTVRSGSWKAQMGISRGCSLLPPPPPLEETWERARETMLELAWEMPLDRRFSAMRNGVTLEHTQLTQNFPLMWWKGFPSQGKTGSLSCYQISRPSFSSQIQSEKYRKWYFLQALPLAPNIQSSFYPFWNLPELLFPMTLFPLPFSNITGTHSLGNLVIVQWEEERITEMGLHLARSTQIILPIIFRVLENVEKGVHYKKLKTNLKHSGTFFPTVNDIYLYYLL